MLLEDVCAWNITLENSENSANPHSRPVTVGVLEVFSTYFGSLFNSQIADKEYNLINSNSSNDLNQI